ncbi:hypothetical protein Pfo_013792 [Paulownia fortunei]|nr:hypothetical protein Pfo_013792 [Paulownia fortunei]
MLLKNMMEDKKLNFNQPILSVRRYSSIMTSQKADERKIDNALPVVPRLPPYRSELKSGPVRNPGAVPFQWEQIPGRPKEQIKPQTQKCDRPPIAPKLPPGKYPKANEHDSHHVTPSTGDNKIKAVNIPHDSQTGPSLDKTTKHFERIKEITEESKSSDSGDCDEAFVNALDTLSRSESFLLNCSMSGLTGMDDLDANTSGSFLTDSQTQEFMMGRFLPAAKALVSETPQYAPKKKSAVQEQSQQLKKKIVNQDKPTLRYGPSFAKRYSHYHNNEEKEESDDDCDQHGNLLAVCRLLPRFCFKSSVCLLNPVPAMSVRTRATMFPANRIQSRSSSAGSSIDTENEYEVKPVDKIQTAELKENKNSLKNEKEVLGIPEETKHTGIKSSGSHRKGFKTFQELLADQGSPKELDSGGSVVEKTVYVDTVHKVDNMRSGSPNTQDTGVPGSREEDNEDNTKIMDQMHIIDSSVEDFKKLNDVDGEAKLLPNAHRCGDFNIVSSIDKSNSKSGIVIPKALEENPDSKLDSTTTEKIEVAQKEATKNIEKQLPRVVTLGNSHERYSEFPVPPPLPKSPSDSWLWRTLPSMSTKNASLRPYLGPQNHGFKARTGDIKWEAIVKSTKVHHHNLCYSEELLTPVPET